MSLNQLFKPKEEAPEVGASISELQSQILGDFQKVTAAAAAMKAGTATAEQKEIIQSLYQMALKSAVPPKLSEDKRTVQITLPPPAPPIPIEVPLKDIAKAAGDVQTIVDEVGPAKGVRTGLSVLGWVAENPKLTAGLVIAGLGAWFLGPALAPYIAGAVFKRRK